MKKKMKWILGALVLVLALLQLTNPARTNPPVVNDLAATNAPPAAITTLLRTACYDCHSYETRWPLYARIAPASWIVVRDVNEGRRNFNFSEWPAEAARAAKKLDRINEVLDYRQMPPKKYTLLHPEARLTDGQRKQLLDWTDAEAARLRATTTTE